MVEMTVYDYSIVLIIVILFFLSIAGVAYVIIKLIGEKEWN